MIKKLVMFALVWFAPGGAAFAQSPPPDPIGQLLFPPELVMQHQREIGITATQRSAITDVIGKTQAKMLEFQWEMQSESQNLTDLLGASPVDEAAALSQVDRVLNTERSVKRQQLSMLIRIKNSLTREQQSKLRALRDSAAR